MKVAVEIRKAVAEDVGALLREGLRASDVREVKRMTGDGPAEALWESFVRSVESYSVFADGTICAMYGMAPKGLMCNAGTPWFLATDVVEKFWMRFAVVSGRAVRELCDGYDEVVNYVDVEHEKSIRWLQWLGFDVCKDVVRLGPESHPFYKFTRKGASCA